MSYYTKITKAGLAAITTAMNNNSKVPITYMAFGDGNGYIPEPDENATSLVNEVYRVGVNKVEVHNKNPNWLVCEAIIPSAVGGFNIREVALYDSTGNTMLAIASYPPTYKPTVEEGAAKIQTIRIVIQVDNSGNFELIVDPDVVLATIDYVNSKVKRLKSISEMLSSTPKNGDIVQVTGYYQGSSLGGGEFIFDSEKVNINDGGTILNGWKRINTTTLNLYMFGAIGDGIADDSDAIIAAFKHPCIYITSGDFKLTKKVFINNSLTLLGMGGVIKPNLKSNVIHLNLNSYFYGDGLNIDGSDYSQAWNDNHGMYVFASGATKANRFILRNSNLSNIYGSGIRVHAKVVDVSNNILINVAGSNWTKDSANEYDNYGDGIHIMSAESAMVKGNYIVNEQAFSDPSKVGRGGLIAEFGANNVSFIGNYIQGYDRGIHLELVYDSWVANNNVSLCNCSIILAEAHRCLVEKNTFKVSTKYPLGVFGLACLYSYNGNKECTYIDNYIAVTDNSYTEAALFNGANNTKDINFTGNTVVGNVSTNGGSNFIFKQNNFKPFKDSDTVLTYGDCSFVENVFYGIKLRFLTPGSGSSVFKNRFIVKKEIQPLEITNPSGSGYEINQNKFILPNDYESGKTYNLIESYLSSAVIGELSGNIVIGNASVPDNTVINLLSNKDSASLQKYFTEKPNIYLKNGKDITTLTYTSYLNQTGRLLQDFVVITDNEPNNNAYYQQGTRIKKDRPTLTGITEFITVVGGYATNNQWTSNSNVTLNSYVYSGENVYQATTAGVTSEIAPSHTNGSQIDGTVTWNYVGKKAIFRPFGAKGSAVSLATGADDTATKLNALISSLQSAGVIQ